MNENGNEKSQLSTTEPSLLKSLCLSKKGWGLPAISHQVLGAIWLSQPWVTLGTFFMFNPTQLRLGGSMMLHWGWSFVKHGALGESNQSVYHSWGSSWVRENWFMKTWGYGWKIQQCNTWSRGVENGMCLNNGNVEGNMMRILKILGCPRYFQWNPNDMTDWPSIKGPTPNPRSVASSSFVVGGSVMALLQPSAPEGGMLHEKTKDLR